MVWKYNAVDYLALRHSILLNSTSLDPHFILAIQLSKEEEERMGVPDESVVSYRTKNPGLFPKGEDLAAIEAKAQDSPVSKKRRRQ